MKLRNPKMNGRKFSLLNNITFWDRKVRKDLFPATCTIIKKKGSIPVLPAGRNFFHPIPNSNPGLAGQVSMMLFPVIESGFGKTRAILWTGSKWFALAAEAISDMSLRTDPHPQESVIALTPFLLVLRKKKRRKNGKKQEKRTNNRIIKMNKNKLWNIRASGSIGISEFKFQVFLIRKRRSWWVWILRKDKRRLEDF